MYVIKFQQLFPQGDWMNWRGGDGAATVFEMAAEAERLASDLQADPKNRGYLFRVFPEQCTDPDALAAADRRRFQV